MLKGRLGLSTARVPQADRHGLLWLGRGKLHVTDGCLTFVTVGAGDLEEGAYQIPFQKLSNIAIGPGTTISHDALRLLARHQTGLIAVGEDGVRFYASMPYGPDHSKLARHQATLWADPESRISVAKKMYELRLGEALPQEDLNALRGIEGHRIKTVYREMADQIGIEWKGRRYDRNNPEGDDLPNRAINHVATAVRAAAMIAVAVIGAIPRLGFIHEASGKAFVLDIADLFRSSITIPVSFKAVRLYRERGYGKLERVTRKLIGRELQKQKVIPEMIDNIKEVLDVDNYCRDA